MKRNDSTQPSPPAPQAKRSRVQKCPYLDTVNRQLLDFDFEKVCSVTLATTNVYACMVCGKYFQGRGVGTPARVHSLDCDHHVFINLETRKIYCLPDDYEVDDPSFDDVKYLLSPTFTEEDVAKLSTLTKPTRCFAGLAEYYPGFCGLNNVKATDYVNVVVQALVHVEPLRDFFLLHPETKHKDQFYHRFSLLCRKMWSSKNFRPQVSPHELVQSVQFDSHKRFMITAQSDPVELLQWVLNTLNAQLRSKHQPSIIQKTFQGELRVTTLTPVSSYQTAEVRAEDKVDVSTLNFFNLALDLPQTSAFKDDESILPQIPLMELLNKFDGVTEQAFANGQRRRYAITKLPPYLVMNIKRFTKNEYFTEKNNTIVPFPTEGLDMRCYLSDELRDDMSIETVYDLVVNVRHEGNAEKGVYVADVYNKAIHEWFTIHDLDVTRKTSAQWISISESYMMVFKRRKAEARVDMEQGEK